MWILYGFVFLGASVGLTFAIRAADNAPSSKIDLTSPPPTETPTRRPSIDPPAEAGPDKPREDLVEVTVRAIPPIAEIFIDDVRVGQGPHTAKYVRGREHIIRASAPGFVTKTETVSMTSAMMVNIVLEREAGKGP